MGDTIINVNFDIKDNIFADIKILKASFVSLEDRIKGIEGTSKKSFETLNQQVSKIKMASITQQLHNLSDAFGNISAPGLKFDASLRDLSALTGITGKELQKLGESAKASASEFGGSASASLETYKTILGRLGPDIANNKEALSGMERNVQILSKTMGGDAAGAVDALTTAMLQYGVDLSNPVEAQKEMVRMMDIMANAAQEGAAEVPSISAALKVSGVAATQAKVSFAEANSAIQALAQGGKEGSEAGMALRNILGKMAGEDVIPKEAANKLQRLGVDMNIVSDKTIPFTQRLRELKKAQGDATIMAQVFGVENAAAANILVNSIDMQDDLTVAIQKQGGAQAQANVVMESTEEKLKRMQAKMDNVKISIFDLTGGTIAYLQPLSDVAKQVSSLSPMLDMARGTFSLFKKETYANIASTKAWQAVTKGATVVQKLFNAAMRANPIGLIITGVAALATGVYALAKALQFETTAQRLNNEVKQGMIEKTADQRAELNQLFFTLKNAKTGSDDYNNALKDLERIQPGIVEKYNLQAGAIQDINKAQKEMIANLDVIAQAEALKEISKEEHKKAFLREQEGPTLKDKVKAGADLWLSASTLGLTKAYSAKEHQMGQVHDMKKKGNLASQKLAELQQTQKYKNAVGNTKTEEKTEENTGNDGTVIEGLNTNNTKTTNTDNESSSGKTSTTVDKRNISVKIDKLVENLTVSTTNLKEGLGEVKKQITETLIGAVRDFEVAM
ncbi:MAG TPA: phage tail tape measure protein [Crocinitomicaceae bacterium]|nr:phage tail tape measure protein [Crocinitomicaceae bacterium]